MSQGASIACFAFSTLGQSDEPITTRSIKSLGSSSYRDRRYLEISSRHRIWSLVNILGTHLPETFDIPKISVKIVCTAPKRMPTSLAILRKSRHLSHITRLWTMSTFSSMVASLGRPDLSSSSMPSLSRLNSAAHFSPYYKKETNSQVFS